VNLLFHLDLMAKTKNFDDVSWLGNPVWQNVLDLWTTQEAIGEIRPRLLIESGTNRGGSALFYASLFDLMGEGEVVTIDIEKLHDHEHPRVTWLLGGSTSPETIRTVTERVGAQDGPVMVILDSDHSKAHVAAELEVYAPLVSSGSLMLVQDGIIDTILTGRPYRPGPLPAIREFLATHPEFELDSRLNGRFLITHHPEGWLRRK
jgi:cephalosporin hydroxylase